jgi:hypothetical protein
MWVLLIYIAISSLIILLKKFSLFSILSGRRDLPNPFSYRDLGRLVVLLSELLLIPSPMRGKKGWVKGFDLNIWI